MHKTPIIAHRGASGHAPENTLTAFRTALDMQADMIELDVQVCRSGDVLVFHDTRLKRITGHRGKLKKKTLAEIHGLDAGNGEHIPTLKEVLDELDGKININIEIKSRRSALPAALIVRNCIRTAHWKPENFLVSSFYIREMRRFHEINPDVPVGLLFNRKPKGLKRLIKLLKPVSAHLNVRYVRKEWIEKAHEHGLKVYIWTVDDPQVADVLKNDGADGFFSNVPDRLVKAR